MIDICLIDDVWQVVDLIRVVLLSHDIFWGSHERRHKVALVILNYISIITVSNQIFDVDLESLAIEILAWICTLSQDLNSILESKLYEVFVGVVDHIFKFRINDNLVL